MQAVLKWSTAGQLCHVLPYQSTLGSPALAVGSAHDGTKHGGIVVLQRCCWFSNPSHRVAKWYFRAELQRSWVIPSPASGCLLEGDDIEIFLDLFPFQSRMENIEGMHLLEFCQCPGKHFNSSDSPVAFKGVLLNF